MFLNSGLHIDQAPPLDVPLRFFATVPLFLLLAAGALLYWGGELLGFPLMPQTVATTHLLVLGCLAMVMFGAMYQMIPVLAGVRVSRPGLARWVHGLLVLGTLGIFLGIATDLHPWMLLWASLAIGPAVLLFLGPIAWALIKAPARHPTVVAMRMAVASLLATFLLGALFLGEYAHGWYDLDRQAMVGIHLTWGLLGWVGVLIIGVSFQVLPMFYMMPTFPTTSAGWILAGVGATLLALPTALLLTPDTAPLLWLAGLPGLAGVVYYGITMARLMAQRQRQRVDTTYRFWRLGFACGVLALGVLALWPAWEEERLRVLFGVLFILGFAASIIFGMLYKIIPFLVWFHRFSRLAGLVPIPMMDDLLPERVVAAHWWLHGATVAALAVGLWGPWEPLLWLAAAGLAGSAGVLAHALWSALRQQPPEAPEMPDFASFFKDMPPPPPLED